MVRARGNYELLYTDINGNNDGASSTTFTPGRTITFRNGTFPDPALCIVDPGGTFDSPADVTGSTANTQHVRVDENTGFTTLVPLWDAELGSEYDHNVGLQSLRGYLMPQHLVLLQNGEPIGTGQMFKVRLEILPLEIDENRTVGSGGPGSVSFSGVVPYISYSRSAQRRTIWWQREWLISANSDSTFEFWDNPEGAAAAKAFSEPLLAGLLGGPRVMLKKLGRITRETWPFLAISIAGRWPAGSIVLEGGTSVFASLSGVAGQEVLLEFVLTGRLRSYLQR